MDHNTLLIDAETLERHLESPRWVVVDCRFSLAEPDLGRRLYNEGHIPGAVYAHLDEDLSGPLTPENGRHPLPDPNALAVRLGALGVGSESQVVAYDDAGGAFAVRLWWLLRWLGHPAVAVLDGGFPGWTASGRPVTTQLPEVTPQSFTGVPERSAWVDTAALLADVTGERTMQVVDARAAERYRGEVEPIDPVAGHIPGALNLPFSGNLDASGHFLPAAQLRERFISTLGATPPERVVHSCGSGVNACHNQLAMEIAGLAGSRIYAGSWSEWIRDPARPVATGATP